MKTVQYFKAAKVTHRFNNNQKVWISLNCANHLFIYFKWRGKGRYTRGKTDKFANYVGEIKTIDVDDAFADKILSSID